MASFEKGEVSIRSCGTEVHSNEEDMLSKCTNCLEVELHTYLRSAAADFLKVVDKRAWLNDMERFRRALVESNREKEYRFRSWHAAISPDLPDIMEICE